MKDGSAVRGPATGWRRLAWRMVMVASIALPVRAATDAQMTVPLWVVLTESARVTDGAPALSSEAIELRSRLGIPSLESDRPIRPEVLAAIAATGAEIRVPSHWLGAVSVNATPAVARRLESLPEVARLVPVGVLHHVDFDIAGAGEAASSSPEARSGLTGGAGVTTGGSAATSQTAFYGGLEAPIRQLSVHEVHALGFTGENVLIAVLDAGFTTNHEALAGLRIVATRDFVGDDADVSDEPGDIPGGAIHGARTLAILAGHAPDRLVGPAYGAELALAKVGRRESPKAAVDEDRWIAALQWADSLGARIVHSSLVFRQFGDRASYSDSDMNGATAMSTLAAQAAAERGILIVTPVGDVVTPTAFSLSAPADAPGVVAVGALDPAGNVAAFSARGPTADGRIKPDVAAQGRNVATVGSGPTQYELGTGTEKAAALVTGVAALVAQAWPELSAAGIRDAITYGASFAHAPNFSIGYGVPDAAMAVIFPGGFRPGPIAGADGTGTLVSLAPTFTWNVPMVHASAGAVKYRLELASDDQFQQVFHRDSVTNATSLTMNRPLRPTATIWWRVVAETETGIQRETRAAGPLFMPRWVELRTLNSASSQFTSTTRPRMTWRALAAPPPVGPLTFDVQILAAQTGDVLQTMAGIQDTTVTVRDALDYNTQYRWRVIARSPLGVADTVESATPFVVTSTNQPPVTLLYQNFPNPFPNPEVGYEGTRIWFDLDRRTPVELTVHDLRGRVVRRLIPAEPGCGVVVLDAGLHGRNNLTEPVDCVLTYWDGRDQNGRMVDRGVYILSLVTGLGRQTRPMLFQPD